MDRGFRRPTAPVHERELTITYHDSCHLCHGQGIRQQPREILQSIPGVVFRELPQSDVCCGSAGIYNLLQPEESDRVLTRKVEHLRSTGCATVATANPGCHLQLERGLAATGIEMFVDQPVVLLAQAYANETGAENVSGPA